MRGETGRRPTRQVSFEGRALLGLRHAFAAVPLATGVHACVCSHGISKRTCVLPREQAALGLPEWGPPEWGGSMPRRAPLPIIMVRPEYDCCCCAHFALFGCFVHTWIRQYRASLRATAGARARPVLPTSWYLSHASEFNCNCTRELRLVPAHEGAAHL